MSEITRKLRIHGEVQGVFYRAWSAETARALGLRGWVRNRSDGTVEILAQGEEAAVQRLIERCRQGPPAARVTRIDVEETDETASAGFEKKPTI
jgi:acylphosphatase